MYLIPGRTYRMRNVFRDHPSYEVRKTVEVIDTDYVPGPAGTVLQGVTRVWFECPNGERRFLPLGQFVNQYFETIGCDLID